GGNKIQIARHRLRPAYLHPDLDRSNGWSSVSLAYGGGLAGCSGRDGRDVVCNWHFWIGCVFRQQAPARVGNSYGPRRTAQGSVTGSAGTRIQVARFWFRGRIAPRNSGQPGARLHRVSSNSPRPARIGGHCSGNDIARPRSDVDSSPARPLDRPHDPPARGITEQPHAHVAQVRLLDLRIFASILETSAF